MWTSISAKRSRRCQHPPKEFRPGPYPELAKADPPEIHGRLVAHSLPNANSTGEKKNESKITYDYNKGKFMQSGVELASIPQTCGRRSAEFAWRFFEQFRHRLSRTVPAALDIAEVGPRPISEADIPEAVAPVVRAQVPRREAEAAVASVAAAEEGAVAVVVRAAVEAAEVATTAAEAEVARSSCRC